MIKEGAPSHTDTGVEGKKEHRSKDEILVHMQRTNFDNVPTFSSEQMASVSGEGPEITERFVAMVKEALYRDPSLFLNEGVKEDLAEFLTRQEMREIVQQAFRRDSFGALQKFKNIGDLLTDEEKRTNIARIAQERPDDIFYFLRREPFQDLYTQTERRDLVLEAARKMRGSLVDADMLREYHNAGTLSVEDVRQVMISILEGSGPMKSDLLKSLKDLEWCYADASSRTKIAETVQRVMTEDRETSLHDLAEVPDQLLSRERKAEIFRSRFLKWPNDFQYYARYAKEYLPPEEYAQLANEFYGKIADDPKAYLYNLEIRDINDPVIEKGTRDKLLRVMIKGSPTDVLEHLDIYVRERPQEEPVTVVRSLLDQMPAETVLSYADRWKGYMPEGSHAQMVEELLLRRDTEYRELYSTSNDFEKLLPLFCDKKAMGYFSAEELEALQARAMHVVDTHYFWSADVDKLRAYGGDTYVKAFFDRVWSENPVVFLQSLEKVAYLYSSAEVETHFVEALDRAVDIQDIFSRFDKFLFYLPAQRAQQLIRSMRPRYSAHLLVSLSAWGALFADESEAGAFVGRLVHDNPYAAFDEIDGLEKYFPGVISREECRALIGDLDNTVAIPQVLRELAREFAGEMNEDRLRILVQRGMMLCHKLGYIDSVGAKEKLKSLADGESIDQKAELTLLDTIVALGKLSQDDETRLSRMMEGIETQEQLDHVVWDQLRDVLGALPDDDGDGIKKFSEVFGSLAPFTLYATQFKNSTAHIDVLRDIFVSTVKGKFDLYKFGERTDEAFQSLKHLELIPEGMTRGQFDIWREESETNVNESIEANVGEVVRSINLLLSQNKTHLGVSEDTVISQESLRKIEGGLRELGEGAAAVGREVGELRRRQKQEGSLSDEDQARLDQLVEQQKEIFAERDALRHALNFLRLGMVTTEEIASGYFLKQGKRVDKISVVLKSMRVQVDGDGQDVLERVGSLIAELGSARGGKQNIFCHDTGDARVTLEIGSEPVPSCQNYADGMYNKCLLGYFDPASKIITTRNEKGTLVARSIFRLLSLQDGTPALHLERVYSTSASDAIRRILLEHAMKKAEEMNMPLYVSDTEDFSMVQNAIFSTKNTSLESKASRAPLSYVDSAGGEQSLGRYTIAGAARVTRGS